MVFLTYVYHDARFRECKSLRVHLDTCVQSTFYVTEISTSEVIITVLNILIRT